MVEDPVRRDIKREGGRWMELLLITVDSAVPPDVNLQLLVLMEEQVITVAKESGYDGILVVNSHPVTMVMNH